MLEAPRLPPRRDGEPLRRLADSAGLKLCGAGGAGQGSARPQPGRNAGGGERLVEEHGSKTRRSWRKLPIGLDAGAGQTGAATLILKEVGDGAYGQEGVSAAVAERHFEAAVIVPPRRAPVPSETAESAPPLVFQPRRGRDPDQLRPCSGTATCKASPSADARPGSTPPATRSGLGPRRPLAGSSR